MRRKLTMLLTAIICILLVLSACAPPEQPDSAQDKIPPAPTALPSPSPQSTPVPERATEDGTPKYVFVMIGDGMGFAQRKMTTLYLQQTSGDKSRQLVMDTFPVQGVNTTYSLNAIVTDSAAAGTALATGSKTNNGLVSTAPDGQPLQTIMEAAMSEHGMTTGLVTTTQLTHATPACFGAHDSSRNNENAIAEDYLNSGIDFFAGGGIRHFIPESYDADAQDAAGRSIRSWRDDERDLIGEFTQAGYTTFVGVDGAADFLSYSPSAGDKVLAAFTYTHMPYTIDATNNDTINVPTLAQMTQKAIDTLSQDDDGFVLMVEGGRIDHACHLNDAASAVMDTLAFDDAVQAALDFYTAHPDDTLVLVVADHETGGLWLPSEAETTCNMSLIRAVAASIQDDIADADIGGDDEFYAYIAQHCGLTDLSDAEASQIAAALDTDRGDDADTYGSYEPHAIAVAHILAQRMGVHWSTFGHTSAVVPLTAIGIGAKRFGGYHDNADVGETLFAVLGLE